MGGEAGGRKRRKMQPTDAVEQIICNLENRRDGVTELTVGSVEMSSFSRFNSRFDSHMEGMDEGGGDTETTSKKRKKKSPPTGMKKYSAYAESEFASLCWGCCWLLHCG